MARIKTIKDIILDILFPPICVQCKKSIKKQEDILCKQCFNLLHINNAFMCPKCGARKPSYINICHQTPYILAPACFYHEPIPALIHNYKYKSIKSIKKILSALLIIYVKSLPIDTNKFYISYVPIHKTKERKRGFNQSKELAITLSKYFNIPIIQTLQKTKNNDQQAKMKSQMDRLNNIKNTIKIKKGAEIEEKNIIIVDDISTSGATLFEASAVLKENGAKKIIGLVVAKAD